MLNLNDEEHVFIPERYLTRLEVLYHSDTLGKGILIPARELNLALSTGRVHPNAVLNRDVTYIKKETAYYD